MRTTYPSPRDSEYCLAATIREFGGRFGDGGAGGGEEVWEEGGTGGVGGGGGEGDGRGRYA